MRMPVGARAVRLQAGDGPHGEVALAGQRANGDGDGAGGDAGDFAEQAAAVPAINAEGIGKSHDQQDRHGKRAREREP